MSKKFIFLSLLPLCLNAMDSTLNQRSIRDYLVQNPALIKARIEEHSLNLSNLNLTSLDGLEYIPDIGSIYSLNLENNHLKTIANNSFHFIPDLEKLNLSHNNIEHIEPLAFNNLSDLTQLNLSHNKLSKIGVWLGHLFQLRTLDASVNNISLIATNAFRDQPSLQELYLGNNQLQKLPLSDIKKLKNLTRLELSDNPLALTPEQEEELEDILPSHTIIIF